MNDSPRNDEDVDHPHHQAGCWARYLHRCCAQLWGLGGCGLLLVPASKRKVPSASLLSTQAQRGRRSVSHRWCNLHLDILTQLLPLWHKKEWWKPWLCPRLLMASRLFLLLGTQTKASILRKKGVWWESPSCDCCSDKVQAVKTIYPQRKAINYLVLWFLFGEQYFRPCVSSSWETDETGAKPLKASRRWMVKAGGLSLSQGNLLVPCRHFKGKEEQVTKVVPSSK